MRMRRPLKNRRPFGPLLDSENDDSAISNETDSSSQRSNQPQITDETRDFRRKIEDGVGIDVSDREALSLQQIHSPMLKSYITNTLRTVDDMNTDVEASVRSVIHADGTEEYARKLGVEASLMKAQSVFTNPSGE